MKEVYILLLVLLIILVVLFLTNLYMDKLLHKPIGIDLTGKPYKYRVGQRGYVFSTFGVLIKVTIKERFWYGGANIWYEVAYDCNRDLGITVTENNFIPYSFWKFYKNLISY